MDKDKEKERVLKMKKEEKEIKWNKLAKATPLRIRLISLLFAIDFLFFFSISFFFRLIDLSIAAGLIEFVVINRRLMTGRSWTGWLGLLFN